MSDIRNLNTYTLGAGLNITSGEPIDSRQYVKRIEQIYDPENWKVVKPYNSLLVIAEDGEARICVDAANYQLESSWKKIGGDVTIVENIEQEITQINTKLETVQQGAQVNAIEHVKVDGAELPISEDKSVNIDLASALAPYAKSSEVVEKSTYDQMVSNLEASVATKADKSEVNSLAAKVGDPAQEGTAATGIYKVIADAETALRSEISSVPKFSIEVVNELPTENISDTTVYLVKEKEQSGDLYTEYIHVNGAWENLGKQALDLSAYSTTEQMNAAIAAAVADVYTKSEVDNALASKVDSSSFESYKSEVSNSLAAKVESSAFESYKSEVSNEFAQKVNSSELEEYQKKSDAEAVASELSDRIDEVSGKVTSAESAIASVKVKDVDSTPDAGISVELVADGKVKAKVDKSSLVSNLVGPAGVVGDLSGVNVKIGTAIVSTEEVEGEQVTETIIDSTSTVAEAVQTLASQIQSAVAGGISGLSGDEFIKVSGTTTSKSLTLEVAKVTEAVANSMVSTNSAVQTDDQGKLQLVWSQL